MISGGKRGVLLFTLLLLGLAGLAPTSAWAVTVCPSGQSTSWINAAGGDFSVSANWSNGVPGPGCDASITLAGTYTVFTTSGGTGGLTLGATSGTGTQTLQILGTTSGTNSPVDALFSVGPSALTVQAHGDLQYTTSGTNPGGATSTGSGTIVNSGIVETDQGTVATNRDIQNNVTNNPGGMIALHVSTNTCGCGGTHTWINNGTITTDPGTISTFTGTAQGVLFSQPTSTGTFVNNGHAEISGGFTNTGGSTSGQPIELCNSPLDSSGSGTASFEFDNLPIIGCSQGSGQLSGDIGPNTTVLIHNNSPSTALIVTLTTNLINHGVLTMDGGAGTAEDQLVGSPILTNAGTLNLSQGATGQIQTGLTNTGTVNLTSGTLINMSGILNQSAGNFTLGGTLNTNHAVNLTGGTFASFGTLTENGGIVTHTGGGTTGNPIQICGGQLAAQGPGTASFQFVSNGSCNTGNLNSDIGPGDSVDVHAGMPGLDIFFGNVINHGSLTLGGGPGQVQLHGTTLTNDGTLTFAGSPVSTNMAVPTTNNGTINSLAGSFSDFPNLLTLAGGSVNVNGTFSPSGGVNQSGGTTTVNGALQVSPGNAVTLTGGTLQGTGTVTSDVVNNSGTVHPGQSPGILNITGNYTQAAAGRLAIDVAGSAPGSGYSRLAVSGNAILAGTLSVTTAAPQTGTFRILTGATRTGTFSPVSFSGQNFSVSYDATGVNLSGTAPPPPPVVTAPVNHSPPIITGLAVVGQTPLSASTGTWSGQALTFTYQWQRCRPGCVNLAGATGSSYAPSAQDVGARLRVIVTAHNSAGQASAASAQTGFVTAKPVKLHGPTISHLSLTGLAKGRAKLSLVFTAGQNAPLIQKITVSVPKGLSFSGSSRLLGKGLTVKDARGHKLKFSLKVRGGVLTITFATATSGAHLTIGHPGLTVSKSLAGRVKHHKVHRLTVATTVTNAQHHTTRLSAGAKPT